MLSFDFRDDTPAEVIAGFSALAPPVLPDQAPTLPTPTVEPWYEFIPDWRAAYGDPEADPFRDEPWRHNWAPHLALSMGGTTTAHAVLTWGEMDAWNLDCRVAWKTGPEEVSEALSWLAPFVSTHWFQRPVLVGHVHHEAAPRPHLFWVDRGSWVLEDLNPDDEWRW
ncbi:hypothetical protein [Nocardioides daphniae]|uniref:Uncharacterized protein n=1 Tax=Nocardioides daphniae TaxID=402297 RepID=A0A4P7UAM6_9ACTN|nr:hypothetical protein [Nocardioides daphniae]QCC76631.1 hypothetical protein E2C04_04345 [Nocardioides daphniae]GGD14852.1 hypothetical protein GCM10007231_12290 [Nocardioides daphniae]